MNAAEVWADVEAFYRRFIDALDFGYAAGSLGEGSRPESVSPARAGEYASQLERAIAEGWVEPLRAAERAAGLRRGTLFAVASRETGFQDIVGDGGHGRGLFQIDDRSHGAFLRQNAGAGGRPPVPVAADYAARLIAGNLQDGKRRGVRDADLERFALAAYNAGPAEAAKAYAAGDPDRATTGKNYGRDVLARRELFAAALGAGGPTAAVSPGEATRGAAAPAPAVLKLRAEVDARWPKRPRASDGIMGDAAHQARKSDHNDGNAIDITRGPGGPDTRALVPLFLKDPRTTYVIHEGQVYNPTIEGGRGRPYTGTNPHTRHIHLSIRADKREDTSAWALDGVPTLTEEAHSRVRQAIKSGLVWAMDQGLIDNVTWVPLKFNELILTVSAEFLSVEGIRMPVSWKEEIDLCRRSNQRNDNDTIGWIPCTQAACDRRWELAARRLVVSPELPVSLSTDAGVDQVLRVEGKLPPVLPPELAEGLKHWILDGATIEKPVNYGLWKEDGTVWQSPGHAHDAAWRDYSQGITLVQRRAILQGKEIDLYARARASGKYDAKLLDYLEGK